MKKIDIFFPLGVFSLGVLGITLWVSPTKATETPGMYSPHISTEKPSVGLTLLDCYQLALHQSETIAIKKEILKEAEGRFLTAVSTALPQATFNYSQTRQNGDGRSASLDKNQFEGKFSFQQPLFTGFKEFAAIAGSRAEKKQRDQDRRRAEQLLFVDVSDAFYFFLNYQETLDILTATQKALQDRIEELQKREGLGRSRASEIASAEAKLYRVEAVQTIVESQQETARELLEFLIGQKFTQINDAWGSKPDALNREEYLNKIEKRPDVAAAREALRISQRQIDIARSRFWPAVSLEGDYYTKRSGALEGIDWDAVLKIEVPLFRGGENWGNLKIARSQEKQTALLLQQTRRNAEREIKQAFTQYTASHKSQAALEKALQATQKNYELQLKDYQLNLVNNLDVLSALEDLNTARQDYINAKTFCRQSWWRLQLTVGELP